MPARSCAARKTDTVIPPARPSRVAAAGIRSTCHNDQHDRTRSKTGRAACDQGLLRRPFRDRCEERQAQASRQRAAGGLDGLYRDRQERQVSAWRFLSRPQRVGESDRERRLRVDRDSDDSEPAELARDPDRQIQPACALAEPWSGRGQSVHIRCQDPHADAECSSQHQDDGKVGTTPLPLQQQRKVCVSAERVRCDAQCAAL
jgi:hypothetical protein